MEFLFVCFKYSYNVVFLLYGKWISYESEMLVTQSCLTLCDSGDCSPPGFSVHGIFQARILEWVSIPLSRGSSQPRDWTNISFIAGRLFTVWTTRMLDFKFQFLWSLRLGHLCCGMCHPKRMECDLHCYILTQGSAFPLKTRTWEKGLLHCTDYS